MELGFKEENETVYHQKYFYKLVYEVFEDMNTPNHSCNNSEHYSKDLCFLEKLHDESIKQIGCTTPYGLNKSMICTDIEKAKKAKSLFENMQRNIPKECLNPCKYVVPQLFFTSQQRRKGKKNFSILEILNNGAIKVTRSEIGYDALTLLADIGGYVGLFLGVAIVHIKELFKILGQKLKSE